jgi:hypothetical protein
MKANELRIGNLVDCIKKRHNEKFIEIESITFDKVNVNFREYKLSDLKPIPLTEEILLKAGFKYQDRDINRGDGLKERFYISPFIGKPYPCK